MATSTPPNASAPPNASSPRDPSAPPPGALRRLWIWFALAPTVWALHEGVSYVGAYNACRAGGGPHAITFVASVIALALVGLATLALARGRRRYPHADITGGAVRSERAAFLSLFGGVLASMALIGVLLGTVAGFVEACR